MAAPTAGTPNGQVQANNDTTKTATLTSPAEGDEYIVSIHTFTGPVTWSTIPATATALGNVSTSGGGIYVFSYIAPASPPSTIDFVASANVRAVCIATKISGGDVESASVSTGANGSSGSPDPDNISGLTSGDYLVVALGTLHVSDASPTYPTSYTNGNATNFTSGGGFTGYWANRGLTSITSENPGAYSTTADDWWAITVAVPEPASGVSGTMTETETHSVTMTSGDTTRSGTYSDTETHTVTMTSGDTTRSGSHTDTETHSVSMTSGATTRSGSMSVSNGNSITFVGSATGINGTMTVTNGHTVTTSGDPGHVGDADYSESHSVTMTSGTSTRSGDIDVTHGHTLTLTAGTVHRRGSMSVSNGHTVTTDGFKVGSAVSGSMSIAVDSGIGVAFHGRPGIPRGTMTRLAAVTGGRHRLEISKGTPTP